MKILIRLSGLLAASALLQLSACESERYVPAAVDAKVDSTLRAAGIGPLQAGKIKIAGNVIINTGAGAVQVADNRKAGQKQGSAATGPASQARTEAKNASMSWYVYALCTIVCLLLGGLAGARLNKLPRLT